MSFNSPPISEGNKSKLLDELRSLTPDICKSEDDPLDHVSDESFERMEKICKLLDSEEIKPFLPHFSNEQEETSYILTIEKYIKDHEMEFSSKTEVAVLSETIENINHLDNSSSSSTSDQQDVKDTLEEVDLILTMGNMNISTPKCPDRNKLYVQIPPTEPERIPLPLPDMRHVTFRKKTMTPKHEMNRSLSASPSCRTQAAVSHSPLLTPYRY